MPHSNEIVLTIGLALWIGVMAQGLARFLRVPPLLFYLLAGVALGPMGLGWIQPDSLGGGLRILVEFGVAIILFEGALTLPGAGFKPLPESSRRMLTAAMPLTALFSALIARWVGGIDWIPAIAFGCLIVVTGPTTIGPLLRSLPLSRRLDMLLKHEAIWGDCLGILLASAVLPLWISQTGYSGLLQIPLFLIQKAALSAALGMAAGYVLGKWLMPFLARLADPELPGVVSLSMAILVFTLGETLSPGSGPIASAVAGFTLASRKDRSLVKEVRFFKGQVAYLFISMLFVLLAALFDVGPIADALPKILLTSLLIGLLVRPLSVFAALHGTPLPVKERAFVAAVGPRGIIALAAASFVVTQLPEDPFAMEVFALTFMCIVFSAIFATLFGPLLARILGIQTPDHGLGILVLGINEFSKALAEKLARRVQVRLIDSDPLKVNGLSIPGVDIRRGDALDDLLYEEADEEGYRRVLALTPNDSLNALALEHAHGIFGKFRLFMPFFKPGGGVVGTKSQIRNYIAFDRSFHMEALDQERADWSVEESDTLMPGQIPLASLSKGGARLVRAGHEEPGPFLVLTVEGNNPF